MDAQSFDTLIRSFAAKPSRRGMMSMLAGTLLGALPSLLGGSDAVGKKGKGKNKKKCRKLDQGCGGKKKCCKGLTCTNGACRTPRSPECDSDDDCGGNETCQNGQCVAECVPACTGGRVCTSGQCECPPDRPHAAPEQYCDDTCRACCIDDHCGRFNGKKCDHTQGSICVCASSFNHDCGQLCTTCCIQEHCIPIIGDQSECVDGGCRCHPGLTACFDPVSDQNKCTDTRTDERNCGECGRDCPPGSECRDSNCA